MKRWKAYFTDALHQEEIQIINTEEAYNSNPLFFTLEGIRFQGTSLGEFYLADPTQYLMAKERFCLLKWGGYDNPRSLTASPYCYSLQRYTLEVEIPIKILRKGDGKEVQGILHIAFGYVEHDKNKNQSQYFCDKMRVYWDDEVVWDFSLLVDGRRYTSDKKTLDFETALQDICKQIGQDYTIRCCFTCQYSEYSPYGNDDYGTILCYVRHKEACLRVEGKDDFFEYLEGEDCDRRQETYWCQEYEIRNKSGGYRGFVEGVE
ncbi:MAG: hypothetical protein IKM28_06710 [Lachnospiraceae bacterium]|nr:hypothetical protein [Lachnospiraceae bacterium]